jgi:hypothetical protein
MTAQDRIKLMKAGFSIFRLFLPTKTITKCSDVSLTGWTKVGTYKTKAECQRAWDELMKDEKNIGE